MVAFEAIHSQAEHRAQEPFAEPLSSRATQAGDGTSEAKFSALFVNPLLGPLYSSAQSPQFCPKTLLACRELSDYIVQEKSFACAGQEYQHDAEVPVPNAQNRPELYQSEDFDKYVKAGDLHKIQYFNNKSTKRLLRDSKKYHLDSEGSKIFSVFFNENNIQEAIVYFHGESSSDYKGGGYFGKLIFPLNYPIMAPRFFMLTPNGRYVDYASSNYSEKKSGICFPFTHDDGEAEAGGWTPATKFSTLLEQIYTKFYFSDGFDQRGQYSVPNLKDHHELLELSKTRRKLAVQSHAVNRKLLEREDMQFVREAILECAKGGSGVDLGGGQHFIRCCHLKTVMEGPEAISSRSFEKLAGMIHEVKKVELEEFEVQAAQLEQQLKELGTLTEQEKNVIKTKLSMVYCSLASLYSKGSFTNDTPSQTIVKPNAEKSFQYQLMASQLDIEDGGYSYYMLAKIHLKGSKEERLSYLSKAASKGHPGAIFMLERLNKNISAGTDSTFPAVSDPNIENYYAGKFHFKEYKKLLGCGGTQGDILNAKNQAREKLNQYLQQCVHEPNPYLLRNQNYREVRAQEYLLEIGADDILDNAEDAKTDRVEVSDMRKMFSKLKVFLFDHPFSGKAAFLIFRVLTALQVSTKTTELSEEYAKTAKDALATARANGVVHPAPHTIHP